jgi:hypothetical protein
MLGLEEGVQREPSGSATRNSIEAAQNLGSSGEGPSGVGGGCESRRRNRGGVTWSVADALGSGAFVSSLILPLRIMIAPMNGAGFLHYVAFDF